MTPKQKIRLIVVIHIIIGVVAATSLFVYVFKNNLNYFYQPKDVAEGKAPHNQKIRVGGMVVKDSIKKDANPSSLKISFEVTDFHSTLSIDYTGILPDLFREGQGVIATGKLLDNGRVEASEILAKHDENYMPPEVKDALDKVGHKPTMPSDTKK